MRIQEKIKEWVRETLEIKGDFVLAHPKDIKNGDYSFYHSPSKANDVDVVAKLNEALRQAQGDLLSQIEKIELAGNFVNFYLSKEFFANSVEEINKEKENFGHNNLLEDQKILIEYTDPNAFKPFHIGHLMSNTIGESLSRLYDFSDSEVKRVNYFSDVGLGIAKAIWGMKALSSEMTDDDADIVTKTTFLGKAYAYGVNQSESDPKIEAEAREINKKIYSKDNSEINSLYQKGRDWSIKHFEHLYEKLGSNFDYFIPESEVSESGKEIVEKWRSKGLFIKSEGAVVFQGEKYDPKLHTRVFITKDGLPTYEAKEIALILKKEKLFSADESIIVTANEQDGYFKVVLRAIKEISPEITEKTKHLSHGMLKLPTGKMSSRTGDVITAEALIDAVKEKVFEKIKDPTSHKATTGQSSKFSDEEKNEIAEIVAIGAIKYSILRQAIGGDIIFDFDKSISFEGDSGPYLQYTAVRANSVLEKISQGESLKNASKVSPLKTWKTTELEKYLYRFPEIVERAGKEYAPHHIVTYLTELASIFNGFYAKEKIINPSILGRAGKNDPNSPYKIALTQAVAHILKSGLNLLGIKVPKRM